MTGQPKCEWAGCTTPAVKYVDGFWHCAGDLAMHYELEHDQTKHVPIADRVQQIRPFVEQGLNDTDIARRVGLSPKSVKRARVSAGLARAGGQGQREFRHGTSSGYKAHRRRGETPCGACAAAKHDSDARNHAVRRQRKTA